MNINYDYYKIFYYVAKCGGVSQAARVLLQNQPNLTRTIKNLENQLGCPLFLRTRHGMKLTAEGKTLYKHVRIAFEHIETQIFFHCFFVVLCRRSNIHKNRPLQFVFLTAFPYIFKGRAERKISAAVVFGKCDFHKFAVGITDRV